MFAAWGLHRRVETVVVSGRAVGTPQPSPAWLAGRAVLLVVCCDLGPQGGDAAPMSLALVVGPVVVERLGSSHGAVELGRENLSMLAWRRHCRDDTWAVSQRRLGG